MPPFVTTIRAEKAPTDQLAHRLVSERKQGAMKEVTAANVVREFEDEFFVRYALVLDTFAEIPSRLRDLGKSAA